MRLRDLIRLTGSCQKIIILNDERDKELFRGDAVDLISDFYNHLLICEITFVVSRIEEDGLDYLVIDLDV